MLRFYDVDASYMDFLRQFDAQVPIIRYDGNHKFLCGTVLKIHETQYYAPISHLTQKQRTNVMIKNGDRVLGSVRLSFMVPVLEEALREKIIADIAIEDVQYANLLGMEYAFCRAHETEIRKKALRVYGIGCNPQHPLYRVCCDFKLLEAHYQTYRK